MQDALNVTGMNF